MPPRDIRKPLRDVLDMADEIVQIIADRPFDAYRDDWIARRAAERCFSILGEALTRAHHQDPATVQRIPDQHAIRRFRNLLVHQYEIIESEILYAIARDELPSLVQQVQALLAELDPPPKPT